MIRSPTKIWKLWNKINDRYGPGGDDGKKEDKKKPSEKEKRAAKQNEKIDKGLTVLKNISRAGVKTPSQIQRFEKVRTKVVRVMKVYCKTLKSKLDNLQDQPKFRKSVRQLTIVVEELNPALVDAADEGEADLRDIQGVDDSRLDQALQDPALADSAADDISFDEDEGDAGTVPSAPPLPRNDGEAARFAQRLKGLMPGVLELQTTDPVTAGALKNQVLEAQALSRRKDHAAAHAVLDRIETILSKGRAGKPASAPGAEPAGDQARLMKRLKEVLPAINQARSEPTPAGQEVKLRNSEMQVLIGKKDFAGANAVLDRIESLLQAPPLETPPETDGAAEFTARLKTLMKDIQKARQGATPAGQEINERIARANTAARTQKFADANAHLDRIEELLAQTAPEGAAPEAKDGAARTLQTWQSAKEMVNSQITRLQGKLRETQDPDFLRIANFGLNGITKRLQVGLHVALMEFDQAQGEARDKARAKAQAAVKDFRAFLKSDPMVAVVEDNPFGVPVTLRTTLGKALNAIHKSLSR